MKSGMLKSWRKGICEGGKQIQWKTGSREEKHPAAPHNNPIMRLINDVMKANSVKIACKQLDLSLLMNSVSLLSKWGWAREERRGRETRGGRVGGRQSEWACREVHFQLPSANGGLSQGTHVDEALLKPSSWLFLKFNFLGFPPTPSHLVLLLASCDYLTQFSSPFFASAARIIVPRLPLLPLFAAALGLPSLSLSRSLLQFCFCKWFCCSP